MSANSSSLNNLVLRPFPTTTHNTTHLTRLERLDIIIKNLEQNQNEVKEQIILEALAERDDIDKSCHDEASDPDTKVHQPDLKALRSKWRPLNKDEKPPRARASPRDVGNGLFVEQQSHVALARDTAAKLDAYAKGTPAALERFRAVRDRILKEEQSGGINAEAVGAGSTEAGVLSAQVATKPQAPIVATTGYDASRDPRRRV